MVSVYCDCKAKTHKVVVPPRNATPFDPLCFRQSTPHIAKDRHVKTSFALASMRFMLAVPPQANFFAYCSPFYMLWEVMTVFLVPS